MNLTGIRTDNTLLLGRVPALVCHSQTLQASVRKGTILFYHGLGASKEVHLAEIRQLAAAGYLVVVPDAVGHGQRKDPKLDQLMALGHPTRTSLFLNIIRETAMELPPLLDELLSKGWIHRERIGITGISMGGHICFLAIVLDPRIQVAVSILGSPVLKPLAAASPHRNLERFSSVRLLSQNAGRDEIVPAAEAEQFHARLQRAYADHAQRFEHLNYPNSGHLMAVDDWIQCTDRMVTWFDRHMP
ncbi:MAG: alpha/beta fold hydrolase [Gammaproteobacteria bacterium]|nr:alpha/beta fold hydrolase [Gammaproteobacteria bacterium]